MEDFSRIASRSNLLKYDARTTNDGIGYTNYGGGSACLD